jgi:phosphomevalonate kinase
MTRKPVAVSAPSKVLFAGGFLVLDRAHTGLVFGLNARIHVHVQKVPVNAHENGVHIAVKSPQFTNARWLYSWNEHEGQLDQIKSYGPRVKTRRID